MTITPASIRNRNPGAMEPGPSSRKFGSTSYETLRWTGPDGKPRENRIATFSTDEHGAAAMFDLLNRKYTGKSLKDAVATWCGGYWAGEYASSVEAACGLKAADLLTKEAVRDAAVAIPIAKAMATVEAGRDFPMDDAGWATAHEMAFGGALAPAPSPDNDVPFPKPEATRRAQVKDLTRKGWLATILASLGGGATHVASNGVPPVPDAVSQGLSAAQAWQGLGTQVAELTSWVIAKPLISVPLVLAVVVLGWIAPKWAEKQGNADA